MSSLNLEGSIYILLKIFHGYYPLLGLF